MSEDETAISDNEIEVRLTRVQMEASRQQDEHPVCQSFDSHIGFFEAPVEWYRLRGLRSAMEHTVSVVRTNDEWSYDEQVWGECDLAEEHRHALVLSLRSLLFSGQFALYDLPIVAGLAVSVEDEEERGEYRVRRVERDTVEAVAIIESSGLLFSGTISWNPANALVCNAKVECNGPNPIDPTTNIASSWEVISQEEGQ